MMVDGRRLPAAWSALFALAVSLAVAVDALSTPRKIKVCRNKQCFNRNRQLLQTVSNLLVKGNDKLATVEYSGCLSHCEKGPNVEISDGQHTHVLNGLDDATTAALQLQLSLEAPIPKLLVAANKVLERASKTTDVKEQERLLSSVISKLQEADVARQSAALAHAYARRAQAYLGLHDLDRALKDARRVVGSELIKVATESDVALAYRLWVDAELQSGSSAELAVAILRQWHQQLPSYRTKLELEIESLLESSRNPEALVQ